MLGFAPPERGDWEDLVRRALRGSTLDDLAGRTDDGFTIQPLYTESLHATAGDPAGLPGSAPFTRGAHADPRRWDLRQRHDLADPASTAAAIRADVAGGATSVWLRLQQPPAPGELLAALAGIDLGEIPVLVDGGPWFADAAMGVEALAGVVPAGGLVASADPLGSLSRHGFLLREPSASLADIAQLAAAAVAAGGAISGGAHRARPITVDATVYADAGAPPALELACVLATAVAYLRALEAGGLEPGVAAQQMQARLVATADQFATICKLRAARTLWDRVLAACGTPASSRRALRCWAVTSEAMFVAQDPVVNLVRATTAAFAAAAGGAECITVLPYDVAGGARGDSGERVRRLARNIGHLLADESHLVSVSDPAGGSWYVEERTERLAEVAWERFRDIEAAGGMAAVLRDGSLAAAIGEASEVRHERRASGAEHVVGVTCFPPPDGDADAAQDAATGMTSTATVATSPATGEIPPGAAVCIEPLPLRRPSPAGQP